MSFLHPAILALLPLAVIPIILHLITLHRLKVTELSTFRFLFDSYMRQQSRLRFMEALLTALRTLFILLLVLLVCRPVVKHWGALFSARGSTDTIMLIDCSASMNARTDGVSALDRAKRAALSVAERLGRNERVTLIRVTAKPEEVFSRFSSDVAAVRDKIEGLETSPARARMFAALKYVFDASVKREAISTVCIFTDAQASSWRQAKEQGIEQLVPEGTRVIVVNVGSQKGMPNCAVVGDEPPRQRAVVGLPVILKPRIVCSAADQPADLTVKAIIGETEVARASVTVKPGEERTAELTYVPKEPGVWRGRFEIPADRFPDDNTFLFTLSVAPPLQVALVNGNPSADPFESEALYLRTAMTAGTFDEADSGVAGGKAGRDAGAYRDFVRSLDVRELPEPALTPDILRAASVVILANCGQLTAQHFAWLRGFVSDGGGLIVFPGDLVKPERYNTEFFPVPGPQKESLSGMRLDAPVGDPDKSAGFDRLSAIDFRHPVLTVFDSPEAKYFASVRIYRHFPMAPAEGRANAWPMARFSGGAPAMVESRLGKGIVLLASFPANAKWSNLPLKPEFVPMVLRMVNYVQRRADVEAPSVAAAEGATEIAVAGEWAPVTGTVKDDAGRTSTLAFRRADARMVGAFEEARLKGYYTVDVKGGAGVNAKSGTVAIAVNVAPAESDFTAIDEAHLQQLMPKARVSLVDASAEAQQLYGGVGDEREIWRPMIWLLFLIIGVEFVLATFSGTKTGQRTKSALRRQFEELLPSAWLDRLTPAGWRGMMGPIRAARGGARADGGRPQAPQENGRR